MKNDEQVTENDDEVKSVLERPAVLRLVALVVLLWQASWKKVEEKSELLGQALGSRRSDLADESPPKQHKRQN